MSSFSSSTSSSSDSIETSDAVNEGFDSSTQYSHNDLPEAEQFVRDPSSDPIKSLSMSTELKQREIRSRSSTFMKDEQVSPQVEHKNSSYAEAVRLVLQRPPRPISTSLATNGVKSSNRIPKELPDLTFIDSKVSRSSLTSDVVPKTTRPIYGKSSAVVPSVQKVIQTDSRTPSSGHQVSVKSSTHRVLQATDDSTPKKLDRLHQILPRSPSIDTRRRSQTTVPNWKKAQGVSNIRQRREKSSPSLERSHRPTFQSHSTCRKPTKMDRSNIDNSQPLLSVKLKNLR